MGILNNTFYEYWNVTQYSKLVMVLVANKAYVPQLRHFFSLWNHKINILTLHLLWEKNTHTKTKLWWIIFISVITKNKIAPNNVMATTLPSPAKATESPLRKFYQDTAWTLSLFEDKVPGRFTSSILSEFTWSANFIPSKQSWVYFFTLERVFSILK